MGTAAHLILESAENDPDESVEEVVAFLDSKISPTVADEYQDDAEFNVLLCALLDIMDSGTSQESLNQIFTPTFTVSSTAASKFSLESLKNGIYEMNTHLVQNVLNHMLLDPGAPRDLCSQEWFESVGWKPVHMIQIPPSTRQFRFGGVPIPALRLVCFICKLTDTTERTHTFRVFAFVLPPTPIPFLLGLQTQRKHALDLCLREDSHSTHLIIKKWKTTYPLVVKSHVWLSFHPLSSDPDHTFNWEQLIQDALSIDSQQPAHNCPQLPTTAHNCFWIPKTQPISTITPPWEKDSWRSNLTVPNIERLHRALGHPTSSSLIRLFRQQQTGARLPPALTKAIEQQQKACRPCSENVELPRTPKLAIPPPATPNIAVSLDTMQHNIYSRLKKFLVMLDYGDNILKLAYLQDDSSATAFRAYLYRWIANFDAPHFTVVDRGSNLISSEMAENLRSLDSQLCPIPTEAPWSLGSNERSHRFLHKVMDKLLLTTQFEPGPNFEQLMAETEMAWNFTLHANRLLPHYNRFGTMPRILGELADSTTTNERIALMKMARTETEQPRADAVIQQALHPQHRKVLNLRSFNVGQKVWFHRKRKGWLQGAVAYIAKPQVTISHQGKLFSTYEARVRPFFGDISSHPEIRHNDDLSVEGALDKPSTTEASDSPLPHQGHDLTTVKLISNIPDNPRPKLLATDDDSVVLQPSPSPCGVIDATQLEFIQSSITTDDNDLLVLHTSAEKIRSVYKLPIHQQDAFHEAKSEEIKFLLSGPVSEVPQTTMDDSSELQSVKWTLIIKRSPNANAPIRYRARLVSAAHLSSLRHSVTGNTPTVGLSSLRIILAIVPTWDVALKAQNNSITLVVRDVTKAYLQSNGTIRLIYYRPPPEYFQMFPKKKGFVWKANVQMYGEVETGRYWNRTIVPWMCANILDYKQCMYDPSLLYIPTFNAATALCTDDAATAITTSKLSEEIKLAQRFLCRNAQHPPTDFKGIDIQREGSDIIISQTAYLSKISISNELDVTTKDELHRPLTTAEISNLRSEAG